MIYEWAKTKRDETGAREFVQSCIKYNNNIITGNYQDLSPPTAVIDEIGVEEGEEKFTIDNTQGVTVIDLARNDENFNEKTTTTTKRARDAYENEEPM